MSGIAAIRKRRYPYRYDHGLGEYVREKRVDEILKEAVEFAADLDSGELLASTGSITAFAPLESGAITAFADGGGGATVVTSANHGRVDGEQIRISGTVDYDGIHNVSSITTHTFRIIALFVSTETGTWGTVSGVTVTSAAHGLANGDSVTISGTTNYNGTYTISSVATNTFVVAAETWISDDATGTWTWSGDFSITADGPTITSEVVASGRDGTNTKITFTITSTGVATVKVRTTDQRTLERRLRWIGTNDDLTDYQ